jgi:hypothetical protein
MSGQCRLIKPPLFAAVFFALSACAQLTEPPLQAKPTQTYQLLSRGEGLPRTGQWRSEARLIDITGDGQLAIALPAARKSNGLPRIYTATADVWQRWPLLQLPSINTDYGGISVGHFFGTKHPDIAFGMHLTGIGVFGASDHKGVYTDRSEGLNSNRQGEPTRWGSQSVLAVPSRQRGREQLLVIHETLQNNNNLAPSTGASLWQHNGQTWHHSPVSQAPRGSHAQLGPDQQAYYLGGDGQIYRIDPLSTNPTATRLTHTKTSGFTEAWALGVAQQHAYLATSHYNGNSWQRLVVETPIGKKTQERRLFAEDTQNRFTALAAQSAATLRLQGELLAVGRESGEISLYHLTTDAQTSLARLATPSWRQGCQVAYLHFFPAQSGQAPKLLALFSGEPNVWDVSRNCTQGGGVDVLALESLTSSK